jgi:hypothetical protein
MPESALTGTRLASIGGVWLWYEIYSRRPDYPAPPVTPEAIQ